MHLRSTLPALFLFALTACGPESERPERPATDAPADTALAATGDDPLEELIARLGELPDSAKPNIAAAMLESVESVPTAADQGGSVEFLWDGERDAAGVPTVARESNHAYAFEVTIGPEGIVTGGSLYLQISPFWEWTTPQAEVESMAGYTTAETDGEGVELSASTVDRQLIEFRVGGAPLPGGSTVRLTYGAGPQNKGDARSDRFAELAPAFYFAIDGDGDGRRRILPDPPLLRVAPGPPAQVIATLTSTARVGETVRLNLAVLDVAGNSGPEFDGIVELTSTPEGLEIPAQVELRSGDGATAELEFTVPETGTYRITAKASIADPILEGDFLPLPRGTSTSNPLRVSRAPRLIWVDLHGHTALSDGTGTPEDYYRYARDVAGLDAVALTDHDAWGLEPLQQHPELWQRIVDAAAAANEPGRFVALPGYEWTSWIFGHRHVVHFGDNTPLFSSLAPDSDTPEELWAALDGLDSLSIPHHPGGGPIAVDWDHSPPADIEPLAEVMSVHGSSVAPFAPRRIYSARPGHYALDALTKGHRYGFLGSGDSHDGHPGLPQLAAPHGGLAAVMCEDLTAASLLEALRQRRVYATTGARILLRANLEGSPMGSTLLRSALPEEPSLLVELIGTAGIDNVQLVTPAGQILIHDGLAEGVPEDELRGALPMPALEDSVNWFYLQVEQVDGEVAWSSPFFLD